MAGYFIYSLDWSKFQQFVDNPTQEQLLAFATIVSDGLDEYDGEFDEGDPVAEWPSEPEELCDIVRKRLSLPDWYGDLSDQGKSIWERAITGICQDTEKTDMGFAVESDGVYWDVIEIARRHHNVPVNQLTDAVLSHFGARPLRYQKAVAEQADDDDGFWGWFPYHSMHTPDEVQRLLEELKAAGPAIEKSGRADALSDYENELLPAVEKVAGEGRMLFIQVDT